MSTNADVANVIDSLGLTLTLEDGDLIADAVLIAKIIEADGTVRLGMSWNDSMSWIERRGLLSAACEYGSRLPTGPRGDHDE